MTLSHTKHHHRLSLTILTVTFAALSHAASATNAAQPVGFQISDQPPVVIDGKSSSQLRHNKSGPVSLAAEPAVEGFADNVPLTVALQQILPQGYGYTLGDGVDPGQLVSWRGGRSWDVVLSEMLRPSGLSYAVNGRSVAVNGSGAPPTVISGSPAPASVVGTSPQILQPADPQVMMQQPVVQQPVMQQQPVMMAPADQQMVMMQPADQQMMVQQQPVMMQQAPVMVQQQPVIMQQPVMIQQQPMMQPADQQMVMMQQPVMMAPADQQMVMMQQPAAQQPVMQQQPVMMAPPPQQIAPQPAVAAPQPLQIENPLLFTPQLWDARPGMMLRKLLQEWCGRVGVELQWDAEYDFPVMASMNMTGTFEEAVRTLLTGFSAVKPTPQARLHYNPAAGQSVLIVEVVGNHYGD